MSVVIAMSVLNIFVSDFVILPNSVHKMVTTVLVFVMEMAILGKLSTHLKTEMF